MTFFPENYRAGKRKHYGLKKVLFNNNKKVIVYTEFDKIAIGMVKGNIPSFYAGFVRKSGLYIYSHNSRKISSAYCQSKAGSEKFYKWK